MRRVSGTHSLADPIATCTPSVSWVPEIETFAMESVSLPCVQLIAGVVDEAEETSVDVDVDGSTRVEDAVELAVPLAILVLVAKIPASAPRLELTTYVPAPL